MHDAMRDEARDDSTRLARGGSSPSSLYGLLAEFDRAEALLDAARRAHAAGYRRAEAYSPFPVDGVAEALGFARTRVPMFTLIGAVLGGLGGFFLQWYAAVVDYPINIGGRPYNSWPMFVPVAFEMAVLCGALAAVAATILGSGLPRLRHPIFNAPNFDLASRDRFFLCLPAHDPAFDRSRAARLLDDLQPLERSEVWR